MLSKIDPTRPDAVFEFGWFGNSTEYSEDQTVLRDALDALLRDDFRVDDMLSIPLSHGADIGRVYTNNFLMKYAVDQPNSDICWERIIDYNLLYVEDYCCGSHINGGYSN
ncbi:hypothetical protein Lal_00011812 [Lupinus albus]|nr:hypothetical protein Lal_00011812 [Lupinus albus]